MRPRLRRNHASRAGTAEKDNAARGRRGDLTMPEDRAEDYALKVAGRIVSARKEAGLTQVELAELIDVSARSMQGYENAEVIPYRKMMDLARVLNKPVEWLLHGEDAVLPSDVKLEAIIGELKNLSEMVELVLSKIQ